MSTTFAHTQGMWARALVAALLEAGVRTVFASPGSRSTPLILALDAEPRLRLVVVIDERTAGFAALGCARSDGVPVALLCTSGSALTHYAPALVEAHYAGIPLVVLSADRPPELQACGASQTIDQFAAFGSFVQARVDLGPPSPRIADFAALIATVTDHVRTARRLAGPVHVNVPLRKPLEPCSAVTDQDRALEEGVRTLLLGLAPAAVEESPSLLLSELERIVDDLRVGPRRVLVVGPLPIWRAPAATTVAALADTLGAVVIAEPASQLRFGSAGLDRRLDGIAQLLETDAGRQLIACDVILQLGPPPTARGPLAFLESHKGRRIVLADHGPADPFRTATTVHETTLRFAVEDLLRHLRRTNLELAPAFCAAASEIAARCRSAIESGLAVGDSDNLQEGDAVRTVLGSMGRNSHLFVGNSLAIREADTHGPRIVEALTVHSQRGAAGIDGNIAGAAGLALRIDRPVVALIGDVAFAHDLGSLALVRAVRCSLTIVVIDNQGGRIFDALPIAALCPRDLVDRLFTTAPEVDIEAAAKAFGLAFGFAPTVQDLQRELLRAQTRSGGTVLHVRVAATGNRSTNEPTLSAPTRGQPDEP